MTSKKDIVTYCSSCHQAVLYSIPKTLPNNPRAWCNRCKKQFSVKGSINSSRKTRKKSNISPLNVTSTSGGGQMVSSLAYPFPDYDGVNIKKLIKDSAIDDIYRSRNQKAARDTLTNEEFLNQAEVKHGIFWNSSQKPYDRPDWVYPWQSVGIDLMKMGHCMWQAGRQKIGKTTGAFMADFEDMLEHPGTVVTLVAPGLDQATVLLRQGFKEVLTLDDGSKFDLWAQLYEPYFITKKVLTRKMVMKNTSLLQVVPLSEYTTPGIATDILHIEELDKAVKDPQKLRALGAILPTIRARREYAKIRITCNNASGIYRVLRDDLKQFGFYFPIYMEVPYDITTGKFSGKHYIYNEHLTYGAKPDIDVILKVLMDCVLGQGYTAQQLGNVDDYEAELWNPDKMEAAYNKGKSFNPKERYEHSAMGIDPGAIHAFAITVYGMDGNNVFHLYTKRFSISGRTETDQQKMIKTIAKTCARAYLRFHCEFVASESNSGAHLIVPLIGYYVNKFKKKNPEDYYDNFAVWREIWSNYGVDSAERPSVKSIPRADFIMLGQFLFDYGLITLCDRTPDEHTQKIEFARYDPSEGRTEYKYKGDCVDSSLHCWWWLCGGKSFINKISGYKGKGVKLGL